MVALHSLILKLVLLFGLHVNVLADLVYFSSLSVSGNLVYCNSILQAALDWMSKGHMLADAVAIIGK